MSTTPALLSLSRPHLALLPGRTRWLHVCHPNPVECDQCLERVAQFLAEEMAYDLDRALAKTTGAYRADLGADVCSLQRAAILQRMTASACLYARKGDDDWDELTVRKGGILVDRQRPGLQLSAGAVAPREYFCEAADRWQAEMCHHASCQASDPRVIPFPSPTEPTTPPAVPEPVPAAAIWKELGRRALRASWQWLLGLVLIPLTLVFGVGAVALLIFALVVGPESESEGA